MRVALDTNVLAYAEGTNGEARQAAAIEFLEQLPAGSVVVPAQVLGELFHVLVRKARRSPADARDAVLTWSDAYPVVATSPSVVVDAAGLAADRRLSIWDSVMLAATADARCRLLLSEDLQDGFTWRGVTVANPFATTRHHLLDALLAEAARAEDESPDAAG